MIERVTPERIHAPLANCSQLPCDQSPVPEAGRGASTVEEPS